VTLKEPKEGVGKWLKEVSAVVPKFSQRFLPVEEKPSRVHGIRSFDIALDTLAVCSTRNPVFSILADNKAQFHFSFSQHKNRYGSKSWMQDATTTNK
jgi:hypothetical protein